MTSVSPVLAFVIGLVIALIVHLLKESYITKPSKENFLLAIGILSARENFDARDAIRSTWLGHGDNMSSEKSYRGWFIVGNRSCDIHPENRVDEYSCVRWTPSIGDMGIWDLIHAEHVVKDRDIGFLDVPLHRQWVSKIYFKVMHPVVVHRLGVLKELLPSFKKDGVEVTVSMTDRSSEEIKCRVKFSFEDQGVEDDFFRYQRVDRIHLHKDFEGTLSVEGVSLYGNSSRLNHLTTRWTGMSNAIVFRAATNKRMSEEQLYLVSFTASVSAPQILRQVSAGQADRDTEWRLQEREVQQRLATEVQRYDDVVIVDIVDVYRNVGQKLLLFHRWLHNYYSPRYVMKTDDDCFVNLQAIIKTLHQSTISENMWWGSFRDQWLVQAAGKWQELDFTADVYPRFACGSGNILSYDLHKWIADNAHRFHNYQGEDVSMGIYFAALAPLFIHDERWGCTEKCHHALFSLPELTPRDIITIWENFQKCNSPCECQI